MWPSAKDVTNDAIRWLEEHDGQDALLQVHYMDPHLPYKEPGAYRHLFAGEGCCGLREEFHLSDVRAAKIQTDEERQYIKDRYDNNIRYATDQIARLFETLGQKMSWCCSTTAKMQDHRQLSTTPSSTSIGVPRHPG